MADPHILTMLRRKQEDIQSAIVAYEAKIAAARRDLSAVNATLRLFELTGEPQQFPVYVDIGRLWRRGEIVRVCRAALEAEGPLDTRELALRVVRAKRVGRRRRRDRGSPLRSGSSRRSGSRCGEGRSTAWASATGDSRAYRAQGSD